MAQVAQLPRDNTDPQELDAERSVLGAMMLSPAAIGSVAEILDAGDFYWEGHGTIYKAALALYARGDPVDAITVLNELEKRGELEAAGGRSRIHDIARAMPTTANAAHHARVVREKATLRGLIDAGIEIARLGREQPGEPQDLVGQAEQIVYELGEARTSGELVPFEDTLLETFERVSHLYETGAEFTGLKSGFKDLDQVTSGFQPANLVVVAARPGMGKSAFALAVLAHVALEERLPCALFSLEMSRQEIAQRLICMQGKVDSHAIRTGKLSREDWPRLAQACNVLQPSPLYVDDSPALSLLELRSRVQTLKRRHPDLAAVVVDYLQLMTTGRREESRLQEVSAISRGLKSIAKDLDLPVLALSQLSRAVEQRHDKKPILSDLRESGCLAGDSRVYLPDEGVYRPIRDLAGRRGFRVLALDTSTWRLEPRRVERAFATGNRPVYLLRTRLGRRVRATGNHKFLAFDGWRRADDLASGMRIALPRRLPGPRAQSLSDPELALLGHLLGDGCTLPRHAIQYTTREPDLADLVVALGKVVFGEAIRPRIHSERTWLQVYLAAAEHLTHSKRNPVAAWLDELGAFGFRAPEKRVPERVFGQPPSGIATFLRHLWATDGCLRAGEGRRYPVIRFDSTSAGLSADVVSLLLRLGITAKVSKVEMGSRGLPSHRIDVAGRDDQLRFAELVGAVGSRRSLELSAIRRRHEGRRSNTNRDVIPREAWRSVVVTAMAASATSTRALQAAIGTSYCGSALYRTGIGRELASPVADVIGSDELRNLAASDVYWDEIVSIERDGDDEVFDLTVEGLHNFVADDVIVHNSIEQDADLVMFLYRHEYYAKEETPEEDRGVAEVIVAKHRNGPTDSIKLTFLNRYAKFTSHQP